MSPLTLTGKRILVVTSDRKLKFYLAEILTRFRWSVHLVDCAAEATSVLFDLNPPKIILIDTALPSPGGVDLATEIKCRPTLMQSWVVLLSRIPDPIFINAAAQAGG